MRAFTCPVCRHLVTFESTECLHCGTWLAFDWDAREIVRLGFECANRGLIACNGQGKGLCVACRLTRTRPPDDTLAQWATAEAAKRRLVFELLELGLPLGGGLAFDLLSSAVEPVTTGHADGVITLDLAEADPVAREQRRTQLHEPYRTLLGHMRHEVGHYFQPILAPEGSKALERCRALMGDERADYAQAMERHYAEGPPADWAERFVSAYATMHPWEDWAETFAHYLHIRDVLQTAVAYGITVSGPAVAAADAAPLFSYPGAAARGHARAARGLAPAHLRAERDQPQHRRRRSLPVRARARGDREAGAHRRARPGRASSMSEATVPVDGEFEMARTFTVEPELERALEQPGLERLTLDLSGTTFIDSTGIGVVLRLANDAESRGVELAIVPGPPEVQRVFATAGLTEVLPFQS